MNKLKDKKIGIWGFGVVGQSALLYFDKLQAVTIQILDSKTITLPTTQTPTKIIVQTEESIQKFLEDNDFILASPGIKLHNYQQFAHKFINELDLLYNTTNHKIIAITGTVGKTTITHLLTSIFKTSHHNTIAAGNIGYPMLSLIDEKIIKKDLILILELSSFQLQPIKNFAPDLAIITNFFANHLDHHQSMQEYFEAKCKVLKYQKDDQKALIPLDLIDEITQKLTIKKNWALFAPTKPNTTILKKYEQQIIYFLDQKIIYCTKNNQTEEIFDCRSLGPLTFNTNWLIIIAACHLQNITLKTISPIIKNMQLPDHRLQKIKTIGDCNFYNDSKSTVWQATLQAVNAMGDKPIRLFLGGLSKGADRTPLLHALQNKKITIYAFGQEAQNIAQLCQQFKIKHYAHATLDASFDACIKNLKSPCQILFSPAGSSFDLFVDYKARGQYFINLVHKYFSQIDKKAK